MEHGDILNQKLFEDIAMFQSVHAFLASALLFLCLNSAVWAERIAVFQYSSVGALEFASEGVLEGLKQGGVESGYGHEVVRFNANGDPAALEPIAQSIIGGGFDLIVTVSTQTLQAVAAVNKTDRIPHVFCVVVSPAAANVGVGEDPADHPSFMTGIGTPQPIRASFELAKEAYPALDKLGIAWNPSEANSILSIQLQREIALSLGIELLEENVHSTAEVGDAVSRLIERGADAIWMGSDNSVNNAVSSIAEIARENRIPVITVIPNMVDFGSLFDLGADYYSVGFRGGEIAAQVAKGANPEAIPVETYVPEQLFINLSALQNLRDPWGFSQDVLGRAYKVIGASSVKAWVRYR